MLVAPVTYQGGKQRLAAQILDVIEVPAASVFYDLCCGSGAVSLALVERGHDPAKIVMVDSGPWGMFWHAIGEGSFSMTRFKQIAALLPANPQNIKHIMEMMYSTTPSIEDIPYIFLLLQAAAIGGAAIDIIDGRWRRRSGFRDLWQPTDTSSRRSPVNPMMPMPATIIARVEEIVARMKGVTGVHGDASKVRVPTGLRNAVAYIDPPYKGTTGYGQRIDATATARDIGCPCWVSEGRPLSEHAVRLSGGRAKGGMTGERKQAANEEWLSRF